MMKNLLNLAVIFLMLFKITTTSAQLSSTNLDEIIAKMTIEEKVGQMTNLTITTIAEETSGTIKLNRIKLEEAIQKYHIGSFQNTITHAYTVEEWHSLIDTIQKITLQYEKHKVPTLYCIDAVHGTNYTIGSTLFPHNLAMAATRNPELAMLGGKITALETRASGIRYDFSPVLDVGRQPLWPRFVETFGEDVYLVKTMGSATIKGYQGTDLRSTTSVAACMKHFLGYSVPQSGKDRAPAYISPIQLREYFLPPFQEAVSLGTKTLMVNSGEINGIPVHADKYLLTDVLRKELGFKGVIISDWEDVKKLFERHRVAPTYKEAVFQSVDAGIDLCIVPMDYLFTKYLIELVKEGRISETRINESVKRVLTLKQDVGLFEKPYVEKEAMNQLFKKEYTTATLHAAREAITLLKNENATLPISKDKKIVIVGPTANSKTALNGCWSYTWQGTSSNYFSKNDLTVVESLRKSATKPENINYFSSQEEIEKNKIKIKETDYIVVCLGEEAYAETVGNIVDLEIEDAQKDLIKSMSSYGKPIILVLLEGRPRIIREIEPLCKGVIMGYWPGPQGGQAIADVLFGDVNPSGKLPFTYPRFSGDILTYDHKLLDEAVEKAFPEYSFTYSFNPQWEFGYGLSYTTFEYSNLKMDNPVMSSSSIIKITVDVKNSGSKAGKEVVELYSRDLFASITPSVKRLRKFTKIELKPGETKTVSFELAAADLAFVNKDLKWITEAGEFELIVKNLKTIINFK